MVAAVLEHSGANGSDASVGGSAPLAGPAPSDSAGNPTMRPAACVPGPAPFMRPAPAVPPKSPPTAANGAAAMHAVASGRSIGSGWTATLPVVLSDHGSSTNSLISLESDMAGRPSLPLSASAVATALAAAIAPQQAAAPPAPAPHGKARGAPPQPPSVPMSPLPSQPSISYLPTVGSASSLQHGHAGALVSGFLPGGDGGGIGAAQAGFLFRTYSDASDLGGGGGSGSAALFHVELPRGYSPPPLFPAGSLPPMAAPSPPPTQGAPPPADAVGANGEGAAPGLRPLRTSAAGPDAGPAPATSVALDASAGFCAPPRHAAAAAPVTADAWGRSGLGPGNVPVFAAAAAAFGAAAPAFRANIAAAAAPSWGRALGGGGGSGASSLLDPSGPLLPILAASPSPHVGTEAWDFARRAAAEREGRKGSGSSSLGRRRSSIEATMPWRARVEAAIAEAEVAAPEAEDAGTLSGQQLAAELNALERAHYERQQQPGGHWQHRSLDAAVGQPGGRGQRGEEAGAQGKEAEVDVLRFEGPPGESPTSLSAPDRHNRSSLESEGDGGSLCAQRRARLSGSGSGSECAASVDSAGAPVAPGGGPRFGRPRRSGAGQCESGYYSRQGQGDAAFELFVRLNRARQTLDFSKRQAQEFSQLDRAELSVWEALDLLQELREYEAGLAAPSEELDPLLPLKDHALQVAELCRLAFPDKEWLALVGLIHGLGKLLAHPAFGSQPQWAVAGETYPLGCRFAPQIGHAEFFCANPDRRRRCFATPNGVYRSGCGLKEVYMSWGAPEYLYLVLALNQVALPEEALFIIRYQKFYSLTRGGGAYRAFLAPEDEALLPLLSAFQRLAVYRRIELPPEALRGQALTDYYSALIEKYIGPERLFW